VTYTQRKQSDPTCDVGTTVPAVQTRTRSSEAAGVRFGTRPLEIAKLLDDDRSTRTSNPFASRAGRRTVESI
jgi:hypothetical protein